MNRVALLIMAHDQPELLARMVRRFNPQHFAVFLFIDGKTAIEPFQQHLPARTGEVVYLPNRHPVHYLGWSVVQAEIKLLQAATAQGPFVRYQLLSGSCYPAQPAHEIYRRMTLPETPEICVWGSQDGLSPLEQKRIHKWHFHDRFGSWKYAGVPRLLVDMVRVCNRVVGYRLPITRKPPGPVNKGSQWWCLKQGSATALLEWLQGEDARRWQAFLNHSSAPDELFFHNAPLPGIVKCTSDFSRHDHLNHFIDWQNHTRPLVLDSRYFDAIVAAGSLFCRKLEPGVSASLLDQLDALEGQA